MTEQLFQEQLKELMQIYATRIQFSFLKNVNFKRSFTGKVKHSQFS